MSRGPVWTVSIRTTPEGEESVAALLERSFGVPASSYTRLSSGTTSVTAYFARRPVGFLARRNILRQELRNLKRFGLRIGPAQIRLTKLPPENWAEAWKRHFKPIDLGPALLIRPSWSRRKPRSGQGVLVLDPGLSFGTGQHPTTMFCLQQLIAHRNSGQAQSCLDLGTGSGILALAAAKLGYSPVEALDNDPESIRAARANAQVNRIRRQIRFRLQDLTAWPTRQTHRYSLVCANLLTPLLLALRPRIVKRLAPGGRLVLAGILRREFPQIRSAYEAAGLTLVKSQSHGEWRSGAMAWK